MTESGDGWALIRRWDSYLAASGRVNANTRRQYRRALVRFLADVCMDVQAVSEDDVVAWLNSNDPRGGQSALVLRALHSFYGWALARDVIRPSPVRSIRIHRPKYGTPPSLAVRDLAAVLAAARSHRDPRLAPTLELMYATGCRIASAVGLVATDVDFDRAWISFRVAKNDDPYGLPMNDRALAACRELISLADYVPPRGTRRPTLVGVGSSRLSQWIQDVETATGIHVHSHLFRHTLATELAHDPAVPIAVTARILNHKDPRTTLRYVGDREGSMADALAGR